MRREVKELVDETFDLLVVGGGVLGASIAWDAALRGLEVALVERDDFGGGASANCLKIVHGGLRYLQSGDVRRLRRSVRERAHWLGSAGHLVEPFPVVMATRKTGSRRRSFFRLGLAANDALSRDLQAHLPVGRRPGPGRLLDARALAELYPGLAGPGVNGGAWFEDARMYSAERLVLEVVAAAAQAGAAVANRVEFRGLEGGGSRFQRIELRDRTTDERLVARARLVINASGAAAPRLAERLGAAPSGVPPFALAMNLVLSGPAIPTGIGFEASRHGGGQFFALPWRGRTLVGTAHYDVPGERLSAGARERHVARFIEEIRTAWPGPSPGPDDVLLAHVGFIPMEWVGKGRSQLLKRPRLIEHRAADRPIGLTVVGEKFTTARWVAARAVDRAGSLLGIPCGPARTLGARLPGTCDDPERLLRDASRRWSGRLPLDVVEHLVRSYGERYRRVLEPAERNPLLLRRVLPGEPVIEAQLSYGIEREWAMDEADLVWRRTELGARGLASPPLLARIRERLADHLPRRGMPQAAV